MEVCRRCQNEYWAAASELRSAESKHREVVLRFGAGAVGEMLRGLVAPAADRMADDMIAIGLVGRGIQSSRSPVMHEREGARLGLNYSYALVDFDALGLPDHALGEVLARRPSNPVLPASTSRIPSSRR